MQTSELDEFTPERQAARTKSQSWEVNSLDSKHLERQALRGPFLDRYHYKRSEKCDCNEGADDPIFTGYFQRQTNLDTGKVAGLIL